MNTSKSITFTKWQLVLFEMSGFIIGLSGGATWSGTFAPYANYLSILGLAIGLYIVVVLRRNR